MTGESKDIEKNLADPWLLGGTEVRVLSTSCSRSHSGPNCKFKSACVHEALLVCTMFVDSLSRSLSLYFYFRVCVCFFCVCVTQLKRGALFYLITAIGINSSYGRIMAALAKVV